MLVSLDDRGLIARTSVPEDARRAEIRITAKGIELVADIAPRSERVYESIDDQFGSADFAQLHNLLERLAQL
jgi:DNA-binding MarR family transcriptional regulator